jgi:hypothetical protein
MLMSEFQVEYTRANGKPCLLPPSSEGEALEYAFDIIKQYDPLNIRITLDGQTIFSRDQIFDHPLAAGKISKSPPSVTGSWGGKIDLR